jgi:hypothetical protein
MNSILRRRALILGEGETIMGRIIDCVPYTKVINLPYTSTTSGLISSATGFVSGGGVEVELDDALTSNFWTPNHVKIFFMPVSASLYDTNIDGSGYPFTGYGWVHPWGSDLTASTTYYGIHPNSTIDSGRGAYGWVAPLGIPIVCDFSAGSNVKKLRMFNLFKADVVAYITYTFKREATSTVITETVSCGS